MSSPYLPDLACLVLVDSVIGRVLLVVGRVVTVAFFLLDTLTILHVVALSAAALHLANLGLHTRVARTSRFAASLAHGGAVHVSMGWSLADRC